MWGLAHWIEQRAMMTPNRLALVGERKRFTYQEMAKTVHRLAHYLHEEMLVKKGERIAILSENREEVFLLVKFSPTLWVTVRLQNLRRYFFTCTKNVANRAGAPLNRFDIARSNEIDKSLTKG